MLPVPARQSCIRVVRRGHADHMLRLARRWLLDGDPAALAAPYRQRLLLAPGLHDEVRAVLEEPSVRRGREEDKGGSDGGVHHPSCPIQQHLSGPRKAASAARGAALARGGRNAIVKCNEYRLRTGILARCDASKILRDF